MKTSRRSRLLVVGMIVVGLASVCCPVVAAQEDTAPASVRLSIGVSFEGLWFSGGEALGMLGGSLSIGLAENLSFAFHYARKAVDFLGFEIASVSVFDVVASYDFSPSQKAGLYIFGGGGYLQAELVGISIGDIFFSAGVGLRLSLGTSGAIFIQYRPRVIEFGEELMHAVEGGFSLAF